MILGKLINAHRFGGSAQLSGDLKTSQQGGEVAVTWPVYLHAELSPRPANLGPASLSLVGVLQPASDGTWSAGNLSPMPRYTAIAYDPTGQHAPAIQAGLQAA
jgi:hypothetical protein